MYIGIFKRPREVRSGLFAEFPHLSPVGVNERIGLWHATEEKENQIGCLREGWEIWLRGQEDALLGMYHSGDPNHMRQLPEDLLQAQEEWRRVVAERSQQKLIRLTA